MKLAGLLATAALAVSIPTAASAADNLVLNGDFEAGNTGFTSDYAYSPGGNGTEAQYTVRSDPYPWNPYFISVADHTSGVGQQMFVGNGAPTAGQIVWQSPVIAIASLTDYFFEAFVMNVCCNTGYPGANSDPLLTFSVSLDGGARQDLATLGLDGSEAGVWKGLSSTFNSGAATNAQLYLINANTIRAGNDFAVDDISLSTESIVNSVPEPATWAMMILGFGMVGGAVRRKRRSYNIAYA